MGLSATQAFLVGAYRAAGPDLYFHWRDVGTGLGYSAGQSEHAARSLDEAGMVTMLNDGNARLCAPGIARAVQLEKRSVADPGAKRRAARA